MRVSKKIISTIMVVMFMFSGLVYADSNDLVKKDVLIERVVKQAEENKGATVNFVDESLINNNGVISPYGATHEEYSHSYYVYSHKTISANSVGPRHNDVFLISVARDASASLTQRKEVSGTVTFEQSVELDIENVIKLGATGSRSGTITGSWEIGRVFNGPTDPKYNSNSFYGAINYDLATCYVKRYDVYKLYSGTAYVNDVTYYIGLKAVSNVKIPKAVEYVVSILE